MKIVKLNWSDIAIDNYGDDSPYTLVFITEQMFVANLLNSLGFSLEIEVIEEYNKNIILKVIILDYDQYVEYDTGKIFIDFPALNHLKDRNVSGWSVGYRKDLDVCFQTPVRLLIS